MASHCYNSQDLLGWVVYLRAADNVSGPFPIWLRGTQQPAISTCHVFSRPSPSLLACI